MIDKTNEIAMMKAVMEKMESNEKEENIGANIVMCDLIISTFESIKDMYMKEVDSKVKN